MRLRLLVAVAVLLVVAGLGGSSDQSRAAPSRSLACFVLPPRCEQFASVGTPQGSVVPALAVVPIGTRHTITATPATNFRFVNWTGRCAGQSASCNYLADASYSSVANFQRIRRTVTVQRSGNGTIRSDPAGIDCGNTCSAQFDQGSQVALDASAPAGIQFNGWGGACSSAVRNARCVITVPAADAVVTASFGPPSVALTVSKTGNGTVTSAPSGINCGGTCTASFPSGTRVTLTARPDPDHPFQGWGGPCSDTSSTCSLTLTAATTVQARFAQGKVDGLTATFAGSWKRSLYTGGFVVSGTASRDAQLSATIRSTAFATTRQSQLAAVEERVQFSVPAGAFTRAFPLPKSGFYPGSYALELTGTIGGAPILARSTTLKMVAPKEGVVSRGWITAGKGKAITRAPRGTNRLVANFVYAAKPFIGSTVRVFWFVGRRPLGTKRKIRWKPIVVTFVRSSTALPVGTYKCVLTARGLTVFEVTARVG